MDYKCTKQHLCVIYTLFSWHAAWKEEVGDGGEEKAAGRDEQTNPPGPHPAGVTRFQLVFGPCRKTAVWKRSHWKDRQAFKVLTSVWRPDGYLDRSCPRPHRSAGWPNPSGSRWRGRTLTLRTGWLWRTQRNIRQGGEQWYLTKLTKIMKKKNLNNLLVFLLCWFGENWLCVTPI